MKTKAVRLYGKNDLRLEEFELPQIKDDEILARIVTDSICMSSHKATIQGASHKRVPDNVMENPVIIGHEFSGVIVEVGSKWAGEFKEGDRFSIQPALNYQGSLDAPGYSFKYIGGDATYIVIPAVVMELGCLLPFTGDAFYLGSLAEPVSCIVGALHANYHVKPGTYIHEMGIKEGGAMAILAGVGPMGLGMIDYTLHCERRPSLLVVTDIDSARLKRAGEIYTATDARALGVDLYYINTRDMDSPVEYIKSLNGNRGYDDVFVMAPVAPVIEQGDSLLGRDGCLNFFAGPNTSDFSAKLNFYNIHYESHHVVGTSGGNTDDMREALDLMSQKIIYPVSLITHIGGLDAVVDTTMNLPKIQGGKKLIYTHLSLELTALEDFKSKGEANPLFAELAKIIAKTNNLWSPEAERYLLANASKL